MQLYKLADELNQAASHIHEMFEAGEIDEQTMNDTLDGLQFDVEKKAINVALHIKNVRSNVEALKNEKKVLDARIKAADSTLSFFENYLDTNLKKSNIDSLSTAQVEIKYRKLPASVNVVGDLPKKYMRVIPEKHEPDKRLLLTALKNGESISGAELVKDRTKVSIK